MNSQLRLVIGLSILLGLGAGLAACGSSSGDGLATNGVPLTITPSPSAGYANGQKITIQVGPNSTFKPNLSIKILQCQDSTGDVAGLPHNVSHCDGNTIQGNTLLVKSDGSFTETGYTVYRLPNQQLFDEPSDSTPICDSTHKCVLYIGENQENFTKPKVFSSAFTVSGGSGS